MEGVPEIPGLRNPRTAGRKIWALRPEHISRGDKRNPEDAKGKPHAQSQVYILSRSREDGTKAKAVAMGANCTSNSLQEGAETACQIPSISLTQQPLLRGGGGTAPPRSRVGLQTQASHRPQAKEARIYLSCPPPPQGGPLRQPQPPVRGPHGLQPDRRRPRDYAGEAQGEGRFIEWSGSGCYLCTLPPVWSQMAELPDPKGMP